MMATKIVNGIGWCDATTNAVTGCEKVSPGCKYCYAESGTRARVLRAQGVESWGPTGQRVPVNFEPVFRRLNKLCVCDKCHQTSPIDFLPTPDRRINERTMCGCHGILRRIRLFADSNSDWLDERWDVRTLVRFLDAIRLAPNIDVLLLTKRVKSFDERLVAARQSQGIIPIADTPLKEWLWDWLQGRPPANVWLGVSVEDQKLADQRIPQLLNTPAAVRFLSVEPLLGKVNMEAWLRWLDWVIVGGESGAKRRDCGVDAIVNVAGQGVAAGVPVYVKQDCAFRSGQQGRIADNFWALKQFPTPPQNR
jgi:protein gp37